MNRVEILPVRSKREQRSFLTFPWQIYHNDPLWVPPLMPDRRSLINPQHSPFFKHGQAEFFIARQNGRVAGTICAAEDEEINQARGVRDCVVGFFECVDDEQVAKALFDRAARWARDHHLDTLYGPFNLDYENAYGVLIDGRDRPPALLCGHTPAYYQHFFEDYGFAPARGDNLAFSLSLEDSPAIDQMFRLAERVKRSGRFTIRAAHMERWESEIDVVYPMINAALAHLPDPRPWSREELHGLFAPFVQIADPDLILFVEEDERAVGFFPGVPDLNQALIHANGLRHPWDYLKLWWYARRRPDCLSIKSVLVYPEYWGSGAAILLFAEMAERARAKGYKWVDLSITSDDNPRTTALAERFGASVYKRYRIYRKQLNANP